MSEAWKSDVARVFEAQKKRRWDVARSDASARIDKLLALKHAIVARREALAKAVHEDFRKNADEFEFTEIHPVLEEINHTIAYLEEWMAPERQKASLLLTGTRSSIRYEARGLVLILAPWNYPFNLLVAPLVTAIAAGNCVVLKPANKTPRLAAEVGKLVRETFREDEVALFEGGHDVANALLELPFDHLFFTGSTGVGKMVMAAAAKHLATVTLELGGKSPVFLDKTADVEKAAQRVAWGKNINAGQTCIAPDYVLAHEDVVDAFVQKTQSFIERYYGKTAEARKASPDFARMIDDGAFRRVANLIGASVEMGAHVACGGGLDRAERYIEPTVLTKVTGAMPIMGEEIFGPVLPVLAVKSMDEAAAFVRERDKPLALYVFAGDRATERSILEGTTAGGTVIGNVLLQFASGYLPFGGVGASGQGAYHGEHGFRTFSHARAVVEQVTPSAAPIFFPPYAERRNQLAQSLLKYLE